MQAVATRSNNRMDLVLDAAAELFATKGFRETTTRDIAALARIQPGSLYYHFANKDGLLLAVYREGVKRLTEAVEAEVASLTDPWERLEAALRAHLETILDRTHYARVLIRVLPDSAPAIADELIRHRNDYERLVCSFSTRSPLRRVATDRCFACSYSAQRTMRSFGTSPAGRARPRLLRNSPGWSGHRHLQLTREATMTGQMERVLVTKIGFDGHDRGSRIVASALRDAGMEVIYTPPWQEIAAVVQLALQEDVDVIGISSLATDHLIVPDLMEALRAEGLGHVQVIVGGIIPEGEHALLHEAGVQAIFGPGAALSEIADSVRGLAKKAKELREEEELV